MNSIKTTKHNIFPYSANCASDTCNYYQSDFDYENDTDTHLFGNHTIRKQNIRNIHISVG